MEVTVSPIVLFLIVLAALCFIILLMAAIISLMRRVSRRNTEFYGMSREQMRQQWAQIEMMMAKNDEMSQKLAIMEADKLLDYGLKSLAMGGTTLAERLKLAQYRYPRLKEVWPAHILRNKLVHEASFRLYPGSGQDSIRRFKAALQEIGIL